MVEGRQVGSTGGKGDRSSQNHRNHATIRRAQVVATSTSGRSVSETADVFHSTRSHIYRTLARFEELGWLGLVDG
jgi:transposase